LPTSKHLVLDDDVYEALLGRRDLTGMPISKIGNGVLRSHIANVLLEDVVGQKLVETGHLSRAEYQDILHQAAEELRRTFQPKRVPVEVADDGTMVAGSLMIANIHRPEDGAFQLLECWARDTLQQPMGQHAHGADEFLVALSGRSLVVMGGFPFILTKRNMLQIPAGVIHSVVPLDSECHFLVLTVPATPEYAPRSKRDAESRQGTS
jgi:mannose-6-phosphate isomerase-like protein (cupin superfamily)